MRFITVCAAPKGGGMEITMPQRITGYTELIGLIADPIRHSKSPMMHNTAFEALGLDYAYLAFEVNEGDLESAVRGLRALGARGFNVSMPYKKAVMEHLDHILPVAELCQSVNTVVSDNGVLTGTCTDGTGFMEACRDDGIDLVGKKVTLLGAGGAATAIAMQAGLDGVREISIFNRQDAFWDRAVDNAKKLNEKTACNANAFPLEDIEALRREIGDSFCLINGTSAGFGDQKDIAPITDPSLLHPELIVCDVIYVPEKTVLMEMAEKAGCRTTNGTGMMLYQGAAAFKLWTGHEMPTDKVKEVLFP